MKLRSMLLPAIALALSAPRFSAAAGAAPLTQGYWNHMLHLGSTLSENIGCGNGAIENDYFSALGGEANIRPYNGQIVNLGNAGTFTWTALTNPDGNGQWFNFGDSQNNYVAYLHTYLEVPGTANRDVRFFLYHDDALKVFINGRQVYYQGYIGQEQTCDTYLEPGLNSITVKLEEGGGGDYVRIALRDRDNQPFSDILYKLTASEIELRNPVTQSLAYTATNTLAATLFPAKNDCDAYQVSLSGDSNDLDPDGWIAFDPANPPAEVTFPANAPYGNLDLYVWFQSTNGALSSVSQPIIYTNGVPTIVATDAELPCVGASTVVKVEDVEHGGSIGNAGALVTLSISCAEDLTPDADYVTLAKRDAPYTVTVTGVNEAGVFASTNVTVSLIVSYDLFNLDFEDETFANDSTPIATENFNAIGGMTHPTWVNRNGNGRGSGIDVNAGSGFATQHAHFFGHNSDYGAIEIKGPNATPFIGTTANPSALGRLWTFSLDAGAGYAPTMNSYDVITRDITYPIAVLRSAPDANGSQDDLLYLTFAEGGYAIGYDGGHVVALPGAAANTAYRVAFVIDADSGTFRVKAGVAGGDLAYIPGIFPLRGSIATKGLGGFYFHAAMTTYGFGETQYRLDNVRLSADKTPTSIDGFLVTDAATGDPATATGAALAITGAAFGPGYTHYILDVGTDPQAPADSSDPRWVSGAFPAAASIPSPVAGTVYTVSLWLLEPDGSITAFSQDIAYDPAASAVSGLAVTVADGVPTATWTTSVPTGGRVWYGATSAATDGATAYDGEPSTSHSLVLEGLEPGKSYYAAVEAGGTRSGSAVAFDYLVDTPAIQNLAISTNRVGHISATWTTPTPAIGWIECAPVIGGAAVRSEFGAYGTSHSAVVGGLDEYTKYRVTVHADAATASQTVRTRPIGAFTLTFDEDPIFYAVWAGNGFGAVKTEQYNAAGGMTHPTYALRRGTLARTDTNTMEPSYNFDTQYVFVRIHNDTGRLELLPDASVTEPFAGTDRNLAASDPWTFSLDVSLFYHFFDQPSFANGYAYINLLSNRTAPNANHGAILSIQLARQSNDLVVLYADANGDEQSVMLVEDMQVVAAYGNRTPVYHLEFVLDMAAQTFDAYVDGTCVATGLGFHSAPAGAGVAGFEAAGGGVLGEHCWLLDNISLTGGRSPAGTLFMLQ